MLNVVIVFCILNDICTASASCKRTDKGLEYVGTVSWTVNSRICQRWDTQYPHRLDFNGNYSKNTLLIYLRFTTEI